MAVRRQETPPFRRSSVPVPLPVKHSFLARRHGSAPANLVPTEPPLIGRYSCSLEAEHKTSARTAGCGSRPLETRPPPGTIKNSSPDSGVRDCANRTGRATKSSFVKLSQKLVLVRSWWGTEQRCGKMPQPVRSFAEARRLAFACSSGSKFGFPFETASKPFEQASFWPTDSGTWFAMKFLETRECRARYMAEEQSRETAAVTKSSSSQPVRILLAEDDKEMRALLSVVLRQQGYEVVEVADGVDLLHQLARTASGAPSANFDLVISDIRLPGISGLEIFERLGRGQRLPPTLFTTAFGDKETHERARKLGAPLFDKPFDIAAFLDEVHDMLSK